MTIHYHGTPITPRSVFETLAGKFFCISFASPNDAKRAHEIGQGVMLDNGAFSIWRSGKGELDADKFWDWAMPWLDNPTTWAVIPDKIEAVDWKENAQLIATCPREIMQHPHKAAPVWHLHEPIVRLLDMADWWPRICFGSSAEYSEVGSESWHRRVSEAFDALSRHHSYTMIHMLRGMKCVRMGCYPFHSVDSTDVARNHHLGGMSHAKLMADEWDGVQCPVRWNPMPTHKSLLEFP